MGGREKMGMTGGGETDVLGVYVDIDVYNMEILKSST